MNKRSGIFFNRSLRNINNIQKNDYLNSVQNYAKLKPWQAPLQDATARESNKSMLGLRELLPLAAGIGGATHGSAGGMGAGLGLAALLHATRGPGLGNMIRGAGQTMQPESALSTLARQAVGYNGLDAATNYMYPNQDQGNK